MHWEVINECYLYWLALFFSLSPSQSRGYSLQTSSFSSESRKMVLFRSRRVNDPQIASILQCVCFFITIKIMQSIRYFIVIALCSTKYKQIHRFSTLLFFFHFFFIFSFFRILSFFNQLYGMKRAYTRNREIKFNKKCVRSNHDLPYLSNPFDIVALWAVPRIRCD